MSCVYMTHRQDHGNHMNARFDPVDTRMVTNTDTQQKRMASCQQIHPWVITMAPSHLGDKLCMASDV